jgi:triacylglycerol esterase/lipase EstA (alpha/beta hydrolase family)
VFWRSLISAVLAVPQAAPAPLPVVYSSVPAVTRFVTNHDGPPPGANDFGCKPPAEHPRPVILVPATATTMSLDFDTISPLLKNNGYCVFALNYGAYGVLSATGEITKSAGELAAFVGRVRAATGAAQVDLVGHSQGGMMPRYYLKFLGGAAVVHRLVGLSPSNHGTTLHGVTALVRAFPWVKVPMDLVAGPAWSEQLAGSDFLSRLNAGGDTVPGVEYTVIQTRYDEVVTPYRSAFLSGPRVTNITVQHVCAKDLSEHLSIAFDHVALREMLNALDPEHPVKPRCSLVLPVTGG